MEVVYYQGSDAHQYLQDVELLDDQDIQSAVPFCLADQLTNEDEQNDYSNMQQSKIGENRKQKNKYNIQIGLIVLTLKNYRTLLLGITVGIILWRIQEILITDIYGYIVVCIVLSNALLIRIIKYDSNQRGYTQSITQILNNFRNVIGQLSVHRTNLKYINLLYYNLTRICEPIHECNRVQEGQLLDIVAIHCQIIRMQKNISKEYELLFHNSPQCVSIADYLNQTKKMVEKILAYHRWIIKTQLVYSNLLQYHDQIKQNERKEMISKQSVHISINKNQYNEAIIHRLQKYLQQRKQITQQQNSQRITAILNLLKLQLKCKYNNIKMNQQLVHAHEDELQRQEQNMMKQSFLQHHYSVRAVHEYLSMSTEGQMDRVQHQQIESRIGLLKGQLDLIIQAKSACHSAVQSKQEQKIGLTPHERRVQGFGSIFKSTSRRPVQQYYIQ